MIDDDKTRSFDNQTASRGAPFNWKALPLALLLRYREEINECLPPTELSKMNMEEEMVLQYHTIRILQREVIDDDTIPPNQRVQVANSVASTLTRLSELQNELYSSERFKAIENMLIRSLSKLPEEVAMTFVTDYEKILETM